MQEPKEDKEKNDDGHGHAIIQNNTEDRQEEDDTDREIIDPELDDKRLVRKLDMHIIPLVMALYCFSFLDRVNIGNARLYSMEPDLGLVSSQFQTAVSILFVTYVLCEIPSNLVLKKFTPRLWISFITTAWGVVAICQGFVQSYGGLLACRLLLGAFEAGLFPGLTVYLTMFYNKRELALRIGFLFVSAAIAGAFGGLLAFGIGHMDGVGGYHSWRWVFILEGLPNLALGAIVFFGLSNSPDSTGWLSPEEKADMVERREREYGHTASAQELHMEDVKKAFKDWKVWVFGIASFCTCNMLYGYSTFLPTIIQGMGKWTPEQVQLLTIPCYFLGVVTYMTVAYTSDRLQRRGVMCLVLGLVCIAGYAVLLSSASASARYAGCFLIAMGLYALVGLPIAWLPNNCPRYGKRTTATAIQTTIANLSGILAPQIYPSSEGPHYVKGNAISMSLVAMSTILYGFLWFWMARENRRREKRKAWLPHYQTMSEEEMADLGDESPNFRYTL